MGKNPCENPSRESWILSTIILNIFGLFIHFFFLSPPLFSFFLIGADEDGDFITGLLWIIMWCNWPSSPIGGALLQLVWLEEASLAQVEAFIQYSWGLASTQQQFYLSGKMQYVRLQKGFPTDASELPIFIVLLVKADVDWNLFCSIIMS